MSLSLARNLSRGMAISARITPSPLPTAAAAASIRLARASSTAASAKPEGEPNTTAPAAEEPLPPVEELRSKARKVYKELHRLGREYPDTEYNFNMRLRRAFEKNASITDPAKLKAQLDLAEHIKKEILAMYSLKKYRHLRRAYHPHEAPREFSDHFAQADHATTPR